MLLLKDLLFGFYSFHGFATAGLVGRLELTGFILRSMLGVAGGSGFSLLIGTVGDWDCSLVSGLISFFSWDLLVESRELRIDLRLRLDFFVFSSSGYS